MKEYWFFIKNQYYW